MKLWSICLLLISGHSYGSGPASNSDAGQKLYEEKCSICHEKRDPKLHYQKTLKAQLQKYAPAIGINAKQKTLILNYMLPKAKDAKKNR